jgi:hypothetical protein
MELPARQLPAEVWRRHLKVLGSFGNPAGLHED